MADFLGSPQATIVFLVAVTAALIAGGVYLIGRVRTGLRPTEPPYSEWRKKVKYIHDEG